jgi:hypothetical protein
MRRSLSLRSSLGRPDTLRWSLHPSQATNKSPPKRAFVFQSSRRHSAKYHPIQRLVNDERAASVSNAPAVTHLTVSFFDSLFPVWGYIAPCLALTLRTMGSGPGHQATLRRKVARGEMRARPPPPPTT